MCVFKIINYETKTLRVAITNLNIEATVNKLHSLVAQLVDALGF